MKVRRFVITGCLMLWATFLVSCNVLSSGGPSNDLVEQEITNQWWEGAAMRVHNFEVTRKAQCELSSNTKAAGIEEEWIVDVSYQIAPDYAPERKRDMGGPTTWQRRGGTWSQLPLVGRCSDN